MRQWVWFRRFRISDVDVKERLGQPKIKKKKKKLHQDPIKTGQIFDGKYYHLQQVLLSYALREK